MATSVVPYPTEPPTQMTAGDSAIWTLVNDLHPGTLWTPSYAFDGLSVAEKLLWSAAYAVADGVGGFTITLPLEATAQLPAGVYEVKEMWTYGSLRDTIPRDPVRLDPNPATLTAGARISWAQQELVSLEAAISAFHSNGAISYYQIGRRIFQRSGLDILMKSRSMLKAEIAAARQPGIGRRMKIAFRSPSRARG